MFQETGSWASLIENVDWNVRNGNHFIVYYKDASPAYIDELLTNAERYYDVINEELGFTRYENFWTWENRVKIYLFDDRLSYQIIANQPSWSGAAVDIDSRRIFTFTNQCDFFITILPHEIGHLIFREFIGHKRRIPQWLSEGVACYLERERSSERLVMAGNALGAGEFIGLGDLEKQGTLHVSAKPDIFYAESASLIEFLVRTYGRDNFIGFCRKLRDLRADQNWESAFKDVYKFKRFSDLNEHWVKFLSGFSN